MKIIPLLSLLLFLVPPAFAGGEALSLEGSVTIRDIVQLRDFSGLDVCPDRRLIAARVDRPSISENRVDHDWLIIEWPLGDVRLKADAGESLITFGSFENIRPQWSPDCTWIYYRALYSDEVQVWRLNVTSGVQEKMTSGGGDVLDFSLIENGRAMIYKTSPDLAEIFSAEEREYRDGVLIDENIFPWHRLTRTLPIRGRWASFRFWSDGSFGHLLSREPPAYKVITIAGHEIRPATESEISELTKIRSPGADWAPQPSVGFKISPSGDGAAVFLPKEKSRIGGSSLFMRLATIQRENPSDVHECLDLHCSAKYLTFLKWSDDGSTIYFIAEQIRGAASVYAWTPESGIVRTILQTEGTLGALASADRYRSMPCPIIEDTALCTAANHGNPPSLMAISLETGVTKAFFDLNSDLRVRFNLRTERIRWKDGFDRDALGVLVYPQGFKEGIRYPLVITTYSCRGFLTGGAADGGPEYVLAENGFLVLCIDFNWDLPPSDVTAKYSRGPGRYVAALSEYETAIDMLVKKGFADRDRVGITGLSFGSQAASYALTHSSAFQVAALRGLGVFEPAHEMFVRPGTLFSDRAARDYNIGKDGYDAETVFKDLAVSLRADRVDAPILVQVSDGEYLFSLPAFAALQKLGKPIEMYVFPDETHQLHQPIHRLVNFERNLDWFKFWLQGIEDPDPAKAEQYARWRKLRELYQANLEKIEEKD